MKLYKDFTTQELGMIADVLEIDKTYANSETKLRLYEYFSSKWSISLDADIKEAENEKRN